SSERRLGQLLKGQRNRWVICTKVGEAFAGGKSRYDFSPRVIRTSIEASLSRLSTEVLDIVLIHSNGDDIRIIEQLGTLEALARLQQEGLVRAIGMSTKTVAGGIAAAGCCDVVMATYNPEQQQEEPVLRACRDASTGVLLKKVLNSGHLPLTAPEDLRAALRLPLRHPGVSSVIIGTLSENHLRDNVSTARSILN
ncbi:MAG: aldo/keto reductase, partial [Pseudomonadota bacterium]